MKNFNPDAFLSDVFSIYWEHNVSKTDRVNYSVCERANLFSLKIEEHTHSSLIRVSEKFSSWIDKELKTLLLTRDTPKKAAVKHNSSALRSSYRTARNATKSQFIR